MTGPKTTREETLYLAAADGEYAGRFPRVRQITIERHPNGTCEVRHRYDGPSEDECGYKLVTREAVDAKTAESIMDNEVKELINLGYVREKAPNTSLAPLIRGPRRTRPRLPVAG